MIRRHVFLDGLEGKKFSIFHINSQLIEVKSTEAFHALILDEEFFFHVARNETNTQKCFTNEGRISADFFSVSSFERFKNNFLFCLPFEQFVMSFAFIIELFTMRKGFNAIQHCLSFGRVFQHHESTSAKNSISCEKLFHF